MDMLAILGVIIGFLALLGGNFLEGGSLSALLNGPAAIIVIGGTLGASILQTPRANLYRALQLLPWAVNPPRPECKKCIKDIINWSKAARRQGLLGLENIAQKQKDRFAKKALEMLVDGKDPTAIRHILENDLILAEARDQDAINFYESMGGYAPTIGILGAVVGLIHVMQNLADPEQLGPGIAIAFVATIYGVALANLLLIPIANKLRSHIRQRSVFQELIIEGIIAIADGENPKAIEMKLSGYL